MATKIDIQLIPLERFSRHLSDFPELPFTIMRNVDVADVSDLLPREMFEHLRVEVGGHRMRVFDGAVKHALIHRYEEPEEWRLDEQQKKEAKATGELLNEVFACSRIVRPTRRLGSVSGYLTNNGGLDPKQTTFPDNALDVPEALKLFAFRKKDLEDLRTLIGIFLTTMHGEYWPFRMAVQYYYMGYEVNDWKGRFLLGFSCSSCSLFSEQRKTRPQDKSIPWRNHSNLPARRTSGV